MSKPADQQVFAVVLAAGSSQRFGAIKQLQEVDGAPIVRNCAALARTVCADNTLLVAGFEQQSVVAAAAGECQFIAINDNYADGMGSSIACAAITLAHSADALIILLADQPLITEDHVNALLGAWSGDDDEIVATAYAGIQGPPVLLPRSTFPLLAELSGDSGARKILQDSDFRLTSVNFDPAAVDIDRPEDLKQLS